MRMSWDCGRFAQILRLVKNTGTSNRMKEVLSNLAFWLTMLALPMVLLLITIKIVVRDDDVLDTIAFGASLCSDLIGIRGELDCWINTNCDASCDDHHNGNWGTDTSQRWSDLQPTRSDRNAGWFEWCCPDLNLATGLETLCVDKTGTLTTNKLSVRHCHPLGRFSETEVRVYALVMGDGSDD